MMLGFFLLVIPHLMCFVIWCFFYLILGDIIFSGEFTDILDEQNALSQVEFQNGGTSTQPEPEGTVSGSTLASAPKSRINLIDVQESKSASHPLLVLENVTLYTPQYSMALFKELSLVVNKGEDLLVSIALSSLLTFSKHTSWIIKCGRVFLIRWHE